MAQIKKLLDSSANAQTLCDLRYPADISQSLEAVSVRLGQPRSKVPGGIPSEPARRCCAARPASRGQCSERERVESKLCPMICQSDSEAGDTRLGFNPLAATGGGRRSRCTQGASVGINRRPTAIAGYRRAVNTHTMAPSVAEVAGARVALAADIDLRAVQEPPACERAFQSWSQA
jgi:hypothetical protein